MAGVSFSRRAHTALAGVSFSLVRFTHAIGRRFIQPSGTLTPLAGVSFTRRAHSRHWQGFHSAVGLHMPLAGIHLATLTPVRCSPSSPYLASAIHASSVITQAPNSFPTKAYTNTRIGSQGGRRT
ncbi:hypothetical protein CRENBAI_021847 [Crenichthys baileyi]|uniref:Uncharacterized protein n=1 Tax=Crenichthys baileyi TaxID=28760 RepID=A0AAV9RI20_9TELE